jgi:predicted transcriptional regulator
LSAITLDLPDDLADRLRTLADRLPRILELGLRELDASSPTQFSGAAEILEFLATLPSPEEVLAIRASAALQDRVSELLEKNRTGGLSPAEEDEWQRYQYVEHLVQLAKARAGLKLKAR